MPAQILPIMPAPQLYPGIPGAIGQGLSSMAQGYNVGQERRLQGQDIQALQQRLQRQQWVNQMAPGADMWLGGAGQAPGQLPMPTMQSPMGQQMMARNLMGMMGRDPTEQALNIARTQLLQRQAGAVGMPPAISELERERVETGIAKTRREIEQIGLPEPKTEEQRALIKAQTEKIEAELRESELLTIDEKRKRDLIAAGLDTKAISKLEKQNIRSQIAKNRAESEKLLRESRGILTPQQKVSQTNTFRKEFDALSSDYRKIRDSYERIKEVAKAPSAAGDLAIIFNYMKMLDPGSVVRESEFATAENAAGVPDKIRNMWNKALTGERIAWNRQDFVNQATNLIRAQEGTQNKLIDRYTKLSNRYGLNPQDVITEIAALTNQGQFTPANQTELNAINREIAELESRMRTPARRPAPIGPLGPVRQQPIPQPQEIIPGIF